MTIHKLVVAGLILTSCGFSPDLSRFTPCAEDGSCAPGFTCLTEEKVCVCAEPSCEADAGIPDAGRIDAGHDAGTPDSGTPDAGTPDAGMPDAGTDDAGTPDAGTPDAGIDGGLLFPATAPDFAIETTPYSFTFTPSGGVQPYSYQLDGGAPGFSLSTTGVLASVDSPVAGQFAMSVSIEDNDTPRVKLSRDFVLEVRPLLRIASPTQLNEGRGGVPYNEPLRATGGEPPYTWRNPDGGTPSWLTINAAGQMSGSPAAGSSTFTVEVIDSATPPQLKTLRTQLNVGLLDLAVTCGTTQAPSARVGTPYSLTVRAYSTLLNQINYSVLSGALPPGILFNNAPPIATLSGTPTAAGTFNFTIRATNGLTTDDQALSIQVFPQ